MTHIETKHDLQGYRFGIPGNFALQAASTFLRKIANHFTAGRLAEASSIARLAAIFLRAPAPSSACYITITVTGKWREDADAKVLYHWQIGVDGQRLFVTYDGFFDCAKTGSDSFAVMRWEAEPGYVAHYDDWTGALGAIPNSLMPGTLHDEWDRLYKNLDQCEISVTDPGNPLLDDCQDCEAGDDDLTDHGRSGDENETEFNFDELFPDHGGWWSNEVEDDDDDNDDERFANMSWEDFLQWSDSDDP